MANIATEIIWITHLLNELHALPSGRPTLLCDNQSSTYNLVPDKRAKHIDLDYQFIRKLIAFVQLLTMFVPAKLQVVDYISL